MPVEDFIEPLGVTQHSVTIALGVPPRRVNEIKRSTATCPGPELGLITCGGEFDRQARSYRDNTVVYARLIG